MMARRQPGRWTVGRLVADVGFLIPLAGVVAIFRYREWWGILVPFVWAATWPLVVRWASGASALMRRVPGGAPAWRIAMAASGVPSYCLVCGARQFPRACNGMNITRACVPVPDDAWPLVARMERRQP